MSFIVCEALHKTYADGTEAVKGIDLACEQGEFVVLLGPSGCGKTTTLRMIAGLEIATAGRILMAGVDITGHSPKERDVGFVFQFYALYPHLKIEENIGFPLESMGVGEVDKKKTGRRDRRALGFRGIAWALSEPVVGRRSAAGGARPGNGAAAENVFDGRALGHARRGFTARNARANSRTAIGLGRDDALRDTRPGGGDEPGRSGRGDGRGTDPAECGGRYRLRRAGRSFCRAFYRQSGDEFCRGRDLRWAIFRRRFIASGGDKCSGGADEVGNPPRICHSYQGGRFAGECVDGRVPGLLSQCASADRLRKNGYAGK